jgi:hypothetical protein
MFKALIEILIPTADSDFAGLERDFAAETRNLGEAQEIFVEVSAPGPWECRLSTDARRYGGAGHEPGGTETPTGFRVAAPAWSALLYRRTAA